MCFGHIKNNYKYTYVNNIKIQNKHDALNSLLKKINKIY